MQICDKLNTYTLIVKSQVAAIVKVYIGDVVFYFFQNSTLSMWDEGASRPRLQAVVTYFYK